MSDVQGACPISDKGKPFQIADALFYPLGSLCGSSSHKVYGLEVLYKLTNTVQLNLIITTIELCIQVLLDKLYLH